MKATCRCKATWSGRAEHCCSCHQTFSGTTAGDLHRVGDHAIGHGPNRRRCLSVSEMEEKGMEVEVNAYGTRIWYRGAAGYKNGKPQHWAKSHAGRVTDGLADQGEGDGPGTVIEGVCEMCGGTGRSRQGWSANYGDQYDPCICTVSGGAA